MHKNWKQLAAECEDAQIPIAEIQYRNKQAMKADLQQHSLSSRALFLLLALLLCKKRVAVETKQKAISLIAAVLRFVCQGITTTQSVIATIWGNDNSWHEHTLPFEKAGATPGFQQVLDHHAKALAAWNMLMNTAWCGHKVASSSASVTLWDLVFFLIWAKAHQWKNNIWVEVCCPMWPTVIRFCGSLLDAAAVVALGKEMQPAPLIKTKKGFSKRVPLVNRLILLQRVKKKQHRKLVMQSHDDIVPANSDLVTQEQFLEASLYLKKARDAFSGCTHFAISWDPSTYDVETLVSIVYSWQNDTACYCPIQNLQPVLSEEVDMEIRKLGAMHKITRIDGYNELRSVSHSLKWFGKPLEAFTLPESIHWQVLTASEERIFVGGRPWVVQKATGEKKPLLPLNFKIKDINLLVSLSDQGGINRASLDFACYKLNLPILMLWDASHRCWNDLRWSLKNTASLFKVFLSYALLFNLGYGPAGTKVWFQKKRARLHEFLELRSAHEDPFLQYLPYIQAERQQCEPSDAAGREAVFSSLSNLNSFQTLGPLTKLMRWFSWFQSEHYFAGEVWCNKMVLMDTNLPNEDADIGFCKEVTEVHIPSGLSEREELNKLKKEHGAFKLAPMLVTASSFWQKSLIAQICKPIWSQHSSRVEHVKSPQQVRDFTISNSLGMWTQELLGLIQTAFLDHQTFRRLYLDGAASSEHHSPKDAELLAKRLETHAKFTMHLLCKRGSSLASQYLSIPFRYSGLLDPSKKAETQRQANSDWKKVLQLEGEYQRGANIKPLEAMNSLKSSWNRLLYLCNEADIICGTEEALDLMRASTQHMGDTICIESTHQQAKDSLRSSRHSIRSRVYKQAAVINSTVLKSRNMNRIVVSNAEKAASSLKDFGPFGPCTHPNKHAMKKSFQQIMMHKSKHHYWPATSQQSLWNEITCFHWLMQYDVSELKRKGFNKATLTSLVGSQGAVVACRTTSQVYLVLSVGLCGFLGYILQVLPSTSTDHPFPAFGICLNRTALQILHVDSLDAWVDVPVKPAVVQEFGPMVFQQVENARHLACARIEQGLALTVAQCKDVLFESGIILPGQPSRLEAYTAIFDTYLNTNEEKERAMSRSACKAVPQDPEGMMMMMMNLAQTLKSC